MINELIKPNTKKNQAKASFNFLNISNKFLRGVVKIIQAKVLNFYFSTHNDTKAVQSKTNIIQHTQNH